MARNDKRIAVTLECQVCKRRNYITTKNKVNDRERIELKKFCKWDRDAHGPQGDPLSDRRDGHEPSSSTLEPTSVVADAAATDVARPAPGGRGPPAPAGAVDPLSPVDVTARRRPDVRGGMADDVDELVAAARAGDRGAFDALVRATYVDTYSLAHRLTGDDEDARDVTQETYLRAFRGLRRFRGDAQFTTWLYRITANCASTHLGRRTRHRHEELHDDLPIDDPRPGTRSGGPSRARRPPGAGRRVAAGPAAPAAGRHRAPRHLRPAPRGHRRRARDLRVGGQGAPPPGSPQAPRRRVPARRRSATRRRLVRCEAVAERLPAVLDDPDGARRRAGRPRRPAACAVRPTWPSTAGCGGP